MLHSAAFHLGLHFLSKYPFRGFQYTKGSSNELENILKQCSEIRG